MTEQPAAYTPAADTVAALLVELMALEAELPALLQMVGAAHLAWSDKYTMETTDALSDAEDAYYEKADAIAALRARIEAAKAEARV